jgi:hypothetical protein
MTGPYSVRGSLAGAARGLERTGLSVVYAAIVWGLVGAVAVPFLMRYADVNIDNASAVVLVYMLVATLAFHGLLFVLQRTSRVERVENEPSPIIGPRLKVLLTITFIALALFFLAATSLISIGVLNAYGIKWAANGSRTLSVWLILGGMVSAALVPMLIAIYRLWTKLEGLQFSVERYTYRVVSIAIVMFVMCATHLTTHGLPRTVGGPVSRHA